ncbi:MAG: COQ9 family protein [Alphaproteobacteria bacterium]|nr:COQ9 family protein [Alphaproteobacteria bacterium]
MADALQAERRALLAAALPLVPFEGWNRRTLRRAAVAAGQPAGMAELAFPGGPGELIAFWAAEADRVMSTALAGHDLAALKVRERLALAIRLRLEALVGQREALCRALALQMLPGEQARAARTIWRTVDAIWRAAGDRSSDFNFYSKRGLLAGVYAATLVFWLDDRSQAQVETWAFLERRLSDVLSVFGRLGRLGKLRQRLPEPWAWLSRLRYGRDGARAG